MLRFLAFLLLAAALWLAWALLLPLAPPQPQVLLFPTGSSSKSIAAQLESAGVVRSRFAFQLLHYACADAPPQGGRVSLRARRQRALRSSTASRAATPSSAPSSSPKATTSSKSPPPSKARAWATKQDFVAEATHDTALVHAIDPQARSLEGYLFPDTYQFSRIMTMHEMAAIMVHRFQKESQALGLGTDTHRLVTLASIVEKETADPVERPEIASVYDNRLAKNMALAADPTVVYAAELQGNYRGAIYQSDLQSDSPYNTYKFAGLPPGPIANPGAASLKAAMQPAQTDYLFFVAVGDGSGRHHFSTTFEQHERNVVAYRKAQRGR